MSKEFQFLATTQALIGKTIVGQIFDRDGLQVGSNIPFTESSTPGIYNGDMPSLSAGSYSMRIRNGVDNTLLKQSMFVWDGDAFREEVLSTIRASMTADKNELLAALPASTGSGSGAYFVQVTVDDGTDPIQDATVRLTSSTESFVAVTNASGIALLAVDGGSWTVSIAKSGASFTPATLVVSGNTTQTYSMSVTAITPSEAGLATGYGTAYSELGVVEEGVEVTCSCIAVPNGTGLVLDSASRSAVSSAAGYIEFTNLIRGAKYKITRGEGDRTFIVPDSESFEFTNLLGTDT